jgi:NADPH:quinone reductase-like Zn-dependent oxidoreductase
VKVAVFKGKGKPLSVEEFDKPKPVKDQVRIKLKYASLNHLDIWIQQDQESPREKGVIPGSCGCGVVDAVGDDADPLLIGMEVIIHPSLDWGNNPIVQGNEFRILGFPDNGTFAEYIVVSKKYIFEKPDHLNDEQSAALPLAALTAYRALFSKARLRANERVLITGIGGGAAIFVLQMAVAYGAKVFVTSASDEKIAKAKSLGAIGGFNYKNPDWAEQAKKTVGGFDIIIDSAAGNQFGKLIELAVPGGRIVNFGRTAGPMSEINMRQVYWKQLSILGSTMGTRDEFLSMIDMMESRKIVPVIDKQFPLTQINEAFDYMKAQNHFGKITIKIE